MIAIAVDDEVLMLGALVKAISASPDIRVVTKFSDGEEALNFLREHPADIAFLDINMRGMGGLALAEKIITLRPLCKIVFCTGYEEYAIPAFKLHASGYLMKLQKGGTIRVVSYETETDYCVTVVDDGVGFDTGLLLDERKHVGLRNIRERLKVMVNGRLEIESTVGVGTKVLVTIPKEMRK